MRAGRLSFAISAIVVETLGNWTLPTPASLIVSSRQSVPPHAGPDTGRSGAAPSPAATAPALTIPTTTTSAKARRPGWAALIRFPRITTHDAAVVRGYRLPGQASRRRPGRISRARGRSRARAGLVPGPGRPG